MGAKQNEDYKKYYAGFNSKIRNSIRLESVLKRIKRYHDNLIRWGLAECVAEVDVDTRNGQKTFLYRLTNVGYIIAYAVNITIFTVDFVNWVTQTGTVLVHDEKNKV